MDNGLRKLVILHTNDIHSHFEQMPGIAGLIRARKRHFFATPVIVIDGGDHMDRMRLETEGSLGEANIAVMNATGYDLAVPGNNEGLTFTRDTLRELYGQARFPVVCCNLVEAETGRQPEWLLPYQLMERDGVRIAWIGATAPFAEFYRLLGWETADPAKAIAEWVERLRGQADVVAVISHLGLQADRHLAETIPWIDLIFGAHTHHLFEAPHQVGDTYLFAAGKYGHFVGEAELEVDLSARRLTKVSGRCIRPEAFVEDAEVAAILHRYRQLGIERLSDVIVRLREPLPIRHDAESALGNLLASGLRRYVGAEIGLVNSGQLLAGLPSGPVTRKDLHERCPSPINPCLMLLSGERILTALEEALLPEFQEKRIIGYGFRGERLGTLCTDGLEVEYDPAGAPYQKIIRARVNGRPLEPDREYRVGTIDMFTFGSGYLTLKDGREIRYELPEFLRDVLAAELADPARIADSRRKRWTAV